MLSEKSVPDKQRLNGISLIITAILLLLLGVGRGLVGHRNVVLTALVHNQQTSSGKGRRAAFSAALRYLTSPRRFRDDTLETLGIATAAALAGFLIGKLVTR